MVMKLMQLLGMRNHKIPSRNRAGCLRAKIVVLTVELKYKVGNINSQLPTGDWFLCRCSNAEGGIFASGDWIRIYLNSTNLNRIVGFLIAVVNLSGFGRNPPDNSKNSVDSEGAAAETIGLEGQKDKDLHAEKQKVEKYDPVTGEISSQNDENDDENKNSATEEQKLVVSPSNEHADKSSDTGEEHPERMINQEEAETGPMIESSKPRFARSSDTILRN
ncbi:unnamed protein product [Fraxinus pennsylvanica]|uniref:Uncharacterized protein n=1 Tax=Fraxinus pennsylvanica TaxID=56036 RepID=A0AAD2E499_9LAMI|nr:unnamed protein product [Fraxinus pennsylvanica]